MLCFVTEHHQSKAAISEAKVQQYTAVHQVSPHSQCGFRKDGLYLKNICDIILLKCVYIFQGM